MLAESHNEIAIGVVRETGKTIERRVDIKMWERERRNREESCTERGEDVWVERRQRGGG